MQKRFIFLAAALFALAACQGHERNSVTGSYGMSVLTGQVSMAADMPNQSPAGVQMSVHGTGMMTVLAADGRFTFAGVPENAVLDFSRADVHASMAAPSSSGPLAIELSANSAHGGKRHSSAPPPWLQFEGTVKSVGTGTLTVTDVRKGDVTFTVDTSTVIMQGENKAVDLSTLKTGTQVHVMALMKGTTLTAVRIIVQDGTDNEGSGQQGTTMTANGTVTATGTGQITVHTEDEGDVVVKIDSTTIIRKQGTTITAADIKVGDQVNTLGTRIDAHTEQARQIEVRGIDQDNEVHGTVTAVGSSSITVAGVMITVDTTTVIRKEGQVISLSDIKVGDKVEAEGTRVNATTLAAKQIQVED